MKALALDIKAVAAAIGVGRSTVYKLIGEGAFPTVKIGSRTLVRTCDLEAWLVNLPTDRGNCKDCRKPSNQSG